MLSLQVNIRLLSMSVTKTITREEVSTTANWTVITKEVTKIVNSVEISYEKTYTRIPVKSYKKASRVKDLYMDLSPTRENEDPDSLQPLTESEKKALDEELDEIALQRESYLQEVLPILISIDMADYLEFRIPKTQVEARRKLHVHNADLMNKRKARVEFDVRSLPQTIW